MSPNVGAMQRTSRMPKRNGSPPSGLTWQDEPRTHDYPAAASFPALVVENGLTAATVQGFESAVTPRFEVNDTLHASRLSSCR